VASLPHWSRRPADGARAPVGAIAVRNGLAAPSPSRMACLNAKGDVEKRLRRSVSQRSLIDGNEEPAWLPAITLP
jgi:hypothetical protein